MRMRRILIRTSQTAGGLLLLAGVALFATTSGCASFGGSPEGARLERMKQFPRYRDGRFVNLERTGVQREGMAGAMVEFAFGNGKMREPSCALPLYGDTVGALASPPSSGLRITWLGHSTTLIELDGRVFLTDPVWSERVSPSTIVGPKRFHPPPLALDRLPAIDAVLISHDHYDHLDHLTVKALAAKGATFHVPLGVGAHLESWGVAPEKIVELGWWDETSVGPVRVVFTPSRHFSGRGVFDRDSTLWTSFSLIGPEHRVFFSGDTGLTPSFQTIGQRLGPFDVAMLEVGQYHPAWGDIHLGPEGALEAHRMLGAKKLFPIHWGTFVLGLHAWSEPAELLATEATRRGVSLVTSMLGQPVEPMAIEVIDTWWRALPPVTQQCPAPTEKSPSRAASAL